MLTESEVSKIEKLDELIVEVLDQLANSDPSQEEYAKMANQLQTLTKVREIEVNLRLKVVDTYAKQRDLEKGQELKATETEARRNELDARIAQIAHDMRLKEEGAANDLRLREAELAAKLLEIEATCELRRVETEGKEIDNKTPRNTVSKDTLAIIAANLLGIGLVLGYERLNVITSKALSFALKLK